MRDVRIALRARGLVRRSRRPHAMAELQVQTMASREEKRREDQHQHQQEEECETERTGFRVRVYRNILSHIARGNGTLYGVEWRCFCTYIIVMNSHHLFVHIFTSLSFCENGLELFPQKP